MDPNPANFPILSYVMSKLPQLRLKPEPDSSTIDIEQPPPRSDQIVRRMPHLSDPKLLASMARTVSEVSQTRSVLQALGDRPEHESIDKAKAKIVEIEARLSKQLEEIVLSRRPPDIDRLQWRAHLAEKEEECRVATEKEKEMYKAIVQLDEMHEAYEKMLKEAEQRLEKIYQVAEGGGDSSVEGEEVIEEVNEEVVGLLQEASGRGIDKVDLSGRRLKVLPEALVRIQGLIILNFSSNQLEAIPDSIAGLSNLEELNLSSNLLESLPDSIGLLQNLKFLNVSGNKLEALPDSICSCRSLVELDASFNNLTYLPTNIGYELVNLKRLSIQLNKIRSLPTSIGEMKSLCNLDAHFNELRGLPLSIGQLSNLEVLNLSNNFTDLKELPDSFGDLTNLKELDLSNNQIHALPDTFGRLDNLVNLNLVENPIEIPPVEVVEKGVEAVKVYMAKRWLDILLEEEQKSMATTEEPEKIGAGWLTRSTSWLSSVAENISGYLSPRRSGDPCLDQQL